MIRVKENKQSLKGLQGSYAYSHVNEYGDNIIIYTKEQVGEIIKTLQYIYDGYSENIKGGEL